MGRPRASRKVPRISVTDLVASVSVETASTGRVRDPRAMALGTAMHKWIAADLRGKTPKRTDAQIAPEIKQYLKFRADHPRFEFAPDAVERELTWRCFVGVCDAGYVVASANGDSNVLLEWKRSHVDLEVPTGAPRMRAPLDHLECTPMNKWALQLAIETILAERTFSVEIASVEAVVFHVENAGYRRVLLPLLRAEAETLMDGYVKSRLAEAPQSAR